MKAVLNIVAAVLVAAGLVVAVASLLTPGQVILGIDFKLAATLVVGGLILYALARALALLERMSNDLRQLRKAGSEEPPWLRQSAGTFAAAMAPAADAAPAAAEAVRDDRSAEVADDLQHDIDEEAVVFADTRWPVASEVQWPEPAEAPAPAKSWTEVPAAPEDEARSPFLDEYEPEPDRQPETAEAAEVTAANEAEAPEPAVEDTEAVSEPEPSSSAVEVHDEAASEPHPAEAALDEQDDLASEPPPVGHHAEVPRKLRRSRDAVEGAEDTEDVAAEPAPAPQDEEDAAEEQPELYVVEERLFRGKQARVLSDGTIEAETAEGWMRFEDFDHLEEYLEAMAEMGR